MKVEKSIEFFGRISLHNINWQYETGDKMYLLRAPNTGRGIRKVEVKDSKLETTGKNLEVDDWKPNSITSHLDEVGDRATFKIIPGVKRVFTRVK